MLPKAPTVGKNVLNRSFIGINSLIPCVFALPENKIPAYAKVSVSLFLKVIAGKAVALLIAEEQDNG